MEFNYTISNKGSYAVVEMSGNLIDKNQATPLLDEIQEYINKGVNSFVISMEAFKHRKNGGDTTICCISDKIKELLIITKLNTVFTITDDLPAAIKQFQN